jgi:hypothetical protein
MIAGNQNVTLATVARQRANNLDSFLTRNFDEPLL